MREFWAISLPNGEVSSATEFGGGYCDGSSAGGGAKEKEKKNPRVSGGWCAFWAVELHVPGWPWLEEAWCHPCCCRRVLQQALRAGSASWLVSGSAWGQAAASFPLGVCLTMHMEAWLLSVRGKAGEKVCVQHCSDKVAIQWHLNQICAEPTEGARPKFRCWSVRKRHNLCITNNRNRLFYDFPKAFRGVISREIHNSLLRSVGQGVASLFSIWANWSSNRWRDWPTIAPLARRSETVHLGLWITCLLLCSVVSCCRFLVMTHDMTQRCWSCDKGDTAVEMVWWVSKASRSRWPEAAKERKPWIWWAEGCVRCSCKCWQTSLFRPNLHHSWTRKGIWGKSRALRAQIIEIRENTSTSF